jgi:hypothetical protein
MTASHAANPSSGHLRHIESVIAASRDEAEERMSLTMVPVGLPMRLRVR